VIEHPAIHGGRDQERTGGCQCRDSEQCVSLSVCEFGDRIRRARGDDEQVGLMRQADMQNMRFIPPQVFFRISTPPGDRLKGERRDEFLRRGVRITSTCTPACVSLDARSAALYAAMEPVTPSRILLLERMDIRLIIHPRKWDADVYCFFNEISLFHPLQ